MTVLLVVRLCMFAWFAAEGFRTNGSVGLEAGFATQVRATYCDKTLAYQCARTPGYGASGGLLDANGVRGTSAPFWKITSVDACERACGKAAGRDQRIRCCYIASGEYCGSWTYSEAPPDYIDHGAEHNKRAWVFYNCQKDPKTSAPTPAPTLPTPTPTPSPTLAPPTPGPTMPPPARLSGDPHARNLRGEKFDIFQTGHVVLFRIPRIATSRGSNLTVTALIDRISDDDCHTSYMRTVFVDGQFAVTRFIFDVGDLRDLTAPFTCQVGKGVPVRHSDDFEVTVTDKVNVSGRISPFMGSFWRNASVGTGDNKAHRTFASYHIHVAGAQIHVQKLSKPHLRLQYLNVEAQNLLALSGDDVGGLLGFDDHHEQPGFKHACEKSLQARRTPPSASDDTGSFYSAL